MRAWDVIHWLSKSQVIGCYEPHLGKKKKAVKLLTNQMFKEYLSVHRKLRAGIAQSV